jgi:hypothetical protein
MIHVIQFKQQIQPGREPVDMVLVAPQGAGNDKTRSWHRVDKIMPPETRKDGTPLDSVDKDSLSYKDMAAKWSVIGPKYEAWKNNNAIPEDGTPLAAWPGITQEQGDRLKQMGILTVEAIAGMNDRTVEQLGWPEARKLPALAKQFLDGKGDAEKDAKMSDMAERLAAMEILLQEQADEKAQLAAMLESATKPDAPKRGRPRKDEAA